MKRIVLLALFLSQVSEAQPLGRLFFTPEERAMLDGLGRNPLARGKGPGGATDTVETKGGGKTVWIEGVPRHVERESKK